MFGLDDNFDICDTITTQNGVEILEVNNINEFGYALVRDYNYIIKLLPELKDKINKNGKFLICENNCGIY
jgi:hypothetical protein